MSDAQGTSWALYFKTWLLGTHLGLENVEAVPPVSDLHPHNAACIDALPPKVAAILRQEIKIGKHAGRGKGVEREHQVYVTVLASDASFQ